MGFEYLTAAPKQLEDVPPLTATMEEIWIGQDQPPADEPSDDAPVDGRNWFGLRRLFRSIRPVPGGDAPNVHVPEASGNCGDPACAECGGGLRFSDLELQDNVAPTPVLPVEELWLGDEKAREIVERAQRGADEDFHKILDDSD